MITVATAVTRIRVYTNTGIRAYHTELMYVCIYSRMDHCPSRWLHNYTHQQIESISIRINMPIQVHVHVHVCNHIFACTYIHETIQTILYKSIHMTQIDASSSILVSGCRGDLPGGALGSRTAFSIGTLTRRCFEKKVAFATYSAGCCASVHVSMMSECMNHELMCDDEEGCLEGYTVSKTKARPTTTMQVP